MAKSLKIIRLVAFIIISIQIAIVAAFSIIYFPNFFDVRDYIGDNYIALGFVSLLLIDCLFLWIVIVRVNAIRNKSDLNAAQIIGNDVQEAYRFAMIGLVVTDENDIILWTSDIFKDRHIDIVDENGESCPPGQTGEIVIQSEPKPPGLLMCYYRNEEKTKAAIHDGWFHTGDVAWKDEDGYYWYVGRNDDVIKSSGYKISPFEIESVLVLHPAVLECAVTGVPDPIRGQIVKATVVLRDGYQPSEELKKELQNFVKKETAPYKYPRAMDFVKELPKTVNGKIMRGAIRKEDEKK